MGDDVHDDIDSDLGEPTRPDLDHAPVRPDRIGRMEEIVFLTGWQALMARTQAAVLDHDTRAGRVRVDQRGATVAATLAQWLGTNAGACLVEEARRLMGSGLAGPSAFVAAWAIHNLRKSHVNHGLRSIEWILLPPGCEGTWADPVPRDLPEPTAADLDLAEHVMAWLGTGLGLAFLSAREAEIEACRAVLHERLRAANRGGPAFAGGLSRTETEGLLAALRAAEARGAASAAAA